MRKILVTSSTGITGCAVVRHLAQKGVYVKAMVHSDRHAAKMTALGAAEIVTASVDDAEDMRRAVAGVDTVFYICPTAHVREGEIGAMAIDIAADMGIDRFVYQSVHNSIEPELLHHRQKLAVEQHLLESGLRYTIVRPAAFMQNILSDITRIVEQHIFPQRFFIDKDAPNRINLIDADDYGEIAAKVTLDDDYAYAQLDICGPRNLSVKDMLEALTGAVGSDIALKYITDHEFISMAESRGMPRYTLEVLLAMFRSYNRHGFSGNAWTSSQLLGRSPNDFRTFVTDAINSVRHTE